MSDQTLPPPPPITDPFDYLQVVLNPDGTLTRNFNRFPSVDPTPHDPHSQTPVLSKDVPINPSNSTWARIFLPRQALDDRSSSSPNKLPLIVYFHGGGFILLSADLSIFHNPCCDLANTVPAVVVSVEYRHAPEHRLPVAYEDGVEALQWIRRTEEEWLREYADFSNCFLMGSSAGGNIAYHVGLRAAGMVEELEPLKIKGLVLQQPFFGGTKRSGSELRLMNDPVLPQIVSDVMWDLSLPVGVDRDHEYSNPTVGGGAKELEKVKMLGWKVMVNGCEGDPLVDRQMEVAELMEGEGVQVVKNFRVGGFHGEEDFDMSKAHAMHMLIKDFVL